MTVGIQWSRNARQATRDKALVAATRPISSAAWVSCDRPATSPAAHTPLTLVRRWSSVRTKRVGDRLVVGSQVCVGFLDEPRTREELERAAANAEAWLDSLDPATTPAQDPADLRRIGLALRELAYKQREVDESVAAAHASGRNWGEIGLGLGISRQAMPRVTENYEVWLAAVQVEDYQAPSWPDGGSAKQMHLDLAVDDLDQAEAEALRLGATRAADQPAPERWRVLLDPAGHPFCLSTQIPE